MYKKSKKWRNQQETFNSLFGKSTSEACIHSVYHGWRTRLGYLSEESERLAKSRATAIELGIPFSDPVADGSIIPKASLNAFQKAGHT